MTLLSLAHLIRLWWISLLIMALPVLGLLTMHWAYHDGQKRGRSGIRTALFVFFMPGGMIAWLLRRPKSQAESTHGASSHAAHGGWLIDEVDPDLKLKARANAGLL